MSIEIVTKDKQFFGAAVLRVEVGTTGLGGGDTGHGGRTFLRFVNEGGDMQFTVARDEVSLTFGGDSELEILIDGLEFALDVLRKSKGNGTQNDCVGINKRQML
jgi:hypothetical protein